MAKCGACKWWNGKGCMNWHQGDCRGKDINDSCQFSVPIIKVKRRRTGGNQTIFIDEGNHVWEGGKIPPIEDYIKDTFSTSFHMRFHEDELNNLFKNFGI